MPEKKKPKLPKYVTPAQPLQSNNFLNPVSQDDALKDWYINYINSPMYRKRLGNFDRQGKNINDIVNYRANQVQNTPILNRSTSEGRSYYSPSEGIISMEPIDYGKTYPREDVEVHELSHITNSNALMRANAISGLTPEEEQYMASKHKHMGYTPEGIKFFNYFDQKAKEKGRYMSHQMQSDLNDDDYHNFSPNELKSNFDAVRHMMDKEGIYDADTQQMTPEIFEKVKSNKNINSRFLFQNIRKNYDDSDIIDILNKVATNEQTTQQPMAKNGKTIKKKMPNGGKLPSKGLPILPYGVRAPAANNDTDQWNAAANNQLLTGITSAPTPMTPSGKFLDVENGAYERYESIPQKAYSDSAPKVGKLTQGKLRGATPNREMMTDLIDSADRYGVDRNTMLGLAANESMFGMGYRRNERTSKAQQGRGVLQQNVISSWDMDNQYRPVSSSQFAYQKNIPGVDLTKDKQGYMYGVQNMDQYKHSLDSALTIHPEWIDEYRNANGNVKPKGNINYFDETADALKTYGLGSSRFNPGDPDYTNKVNQASQLVANDPVVQNLYKEVDSKKKMKDGGSIVNYLAQNKQDFSFEARNKLYTDKFGGKYTGSAKQNTQLLNTLRQGDDAPNSVAPSGIPQPQMKAGAKGSITGKPAVQPTARTQAQPTPYRPIQSIDDPNSPRAPQSGVVVDKRANMAYIMEAGKVVKNFPVITGKNPKGENNMGSLNLNNDVSRRATPQGYYKMDPNVNDFTKEEFNNNVFGMEPIAAFGQPAPKAENVAIHQTYDPATRNKFYSQDADKRYQSYGCVNCRKPDIENIKQRFPQGDTLMVIDPQNPIYRNVAKQVGIKKYGGDVLKAANGMGVPPYGRNAVSTEEDPIYYEGLQPIDLNGVTDYFNNPDNNQMINDATMNGNPALQGNQLGTFRNQRGINDPGNIQRQQGVTDFFKNDPFKNMISNDASLNGPDPYQKQNMIDPANNKVTQSEYRPLDQEPKEQKKKGPGFQFDINPGQVMGAFFGAINQTYDRGRGIAENARFKRHAAMAQSYNPYQYGTGSQALYEDGGSIEGAGGPDEYDLTEDQINFLKSQGYDLEMID